MNLDGDVLRGRHAVRLAHDPAKSEALRLLLLRVFCNAGGYDASWFRHAVRHLAAGADKQRLLDLDREIRNACLDLWGVDWDQGPGMVSA